MRFLRMTVLAGAAAGALAGLGPASTPAAALTASASAASMKTAGKPAAAPAMVHDVQYRRDRRRGFPVYALGPFPSGFGDELRTGRPFYAGRSYDRRSYGYGYYSRPRYVERGYGYRTPCRPYARRGAAC